MNHLRISVPTLILVIAHFSNYATTFSSSIQNNLGNDQANISNSGLQTPAIRYTFWVDYGHVSLKNVSTKNKITVKFWNNSEPLAEVSKVPKTNEDQLNSWEYYAQPGSKLVNRVTIQTNGKDAYFIDQVKLKTDILLDEASWGENNKRGWILSKQSKEGKSKMRNYGNATKMVEFKVKPEFSQALNNYVKQLDYTTPGIDYVLVIDPFHSKLTNETTNNLITIKFYRDKQVLKTLTSDSKVEIPVFDMPTDFKDISKFKIKGTLHSYLYHAEPGSPIPTHITVSINGEDAYYIDQVYLKCDVVGVKSKWGAEDGKGWILSTDPSDGNGSWKGYGECKAEHKFEIRESFVNAIRDLGPNPIRISGISTKPIRMVDFKRMIDDKGLALVKTSDIKDNQCAVVYASGEVGDKSIAGETGLFTCRLPLGKDFQLTTAIVQGGCSADAKDLGGYECEGSLFASSITTEYKDVKLELEVKGPSGSICKSRTRDKICYSAEATWYSTSVGLEDKNTGNGVGIGYSSGFSAGADVGYSDGVFEGELDLAIVQGASMSFTFDPAKTGKYVYKATLAPGTYGHTVINRKIETAGEKANDIYKSTKKTGKRFVNDTKKGVKTSEQKAKGWINKKSKGWNTKYNSAKTEYSKAKKAYNKYVK
jgi:hypothetical protein